MNDNHTDVLSINKYICRVAMMAYTFVKSQCEFAFYRTVTSIKHMYIQTMNMRYLPTLWTASYLCKTVGQYS